MHVLKFLRVIYISYYPKHTMAMINFVIEARFTKLIENDKLNKRTAYRSQRHSMCLKYENYEN